MAFGTTAAIIGSAVVGAGASIYGANKASKAAGKAADQNAQIQREQYQQTRQDLQPYAQAGNVATQALMERLGLAAPTGQAQQSVAAKTGFSPNYGTPLGGAGGQQMNMAHPAIINAIAPAVGAAGAGASTPVAAPAAPGTPDYGAYLAANSDIAAEYQRQASNEKGAAELARLGISSPEAYAAWHYQNFGQNEGRQLPTAQPAAGPAVYLPAATVPNPDNIERPVWDQPAPTFSFNTPAPTFTTPTFEESPDVEDYIDPGSFKASPGYQFRLDEGIRNLNARYGARGLLKSGAAAQGVNDYAAGSASQEYGNWFNQNMQRYGAAANQFNTNRATTLNQFNTDRASALSQYNADRASALSLYGTQLGQWNTDRNVFNQNFENDRAYTANRYDVGTGNLFNLANMGQSAAAGQAGAGQNYAAAATANNNALASVRGNAAIAGANGINNALAAGLTAYGMYSNPFSGSGTLNALRGLY